MAATPTTNGSQTRRRGKRLPLRHRAPQNWESLYRPAGSGERVQLVEFRSEALKPLTGKTLAEAAETWHEDRGDHPRPGPRRPVAGSTGVLHDVGGKYPQADPRPWVSLGSDAGSMAPERRSSSHPRTPARTATSPACWQNTCATTRSSNSRAVRRLSGLPAANLELDRRGLQKEGMFADVVVFDPETVADRATFDNPHQYAVGVRQVFVNGAQVIREGEHTGAKTGRALWGPGRTARD